MRNILIMIAASSALPITLIILGLYKTDLQLYASYHLAVVMGITLLGFALVRASIHMWRVMR